MSRSRHPQPDWPAVAAALASRIPHTELHAAAMLRARSEFLRERRRGGRASRWAVAFSGGADSLALLLLLWAEGPGRWGRDFLVLHFDHRLRGRQSAADARFCQAVCRSLGWECVVGRWAGAKAGASEAETRTARHLFFSNEMNRRRIRVLWLAHQQDDVAETMLMRLSRGSGAAGLSAPRPVQEFADGRLFLRPLLSLGKDRLIAALRSSGAVWREDSTNQGRDFFRNRVRRDVVPAWRKASGRDAVAGAALSRDLLEEDDAALESWVDRLRPVRRGILDLQALDGVPRAVARRALHRWLLAVRPASDLSRQGFNQLLRAVEGGRTTRFSLGRDGFAEIREGKLRFSRA